MERMRRVKEDEARWDADTEKIPPSGLRLDWEEVQHVGRIHLSSDANDTIRLFFIRDHKIVWQVDLSAQNKVGLLRRTLPLPSSLKEGGFDGVRVFNIGPDPFASLGHFLLGDDPAAQASKAKPNED